MFSDAFRDIPQFVKLTRELPRLRDCKEWEQFLDVLISLKNAGRQIGLIIANTPRARVPPSLVKRTDHFEHVELSGGVIAGEALFLKTYELVRELTLADPRTDSFPIVATGGILKLSHFLDVSV